MEMLKSEITLESAMEGYAKYRSFCRRFVELLENDGMIDHAEALELLDHMRVIGDRRRVTIAAAQETYQWDRVADAGRRGRGFSWSAYQAGILAEANLHPAPVLVELFDGKDAAD